MTEYLNNTQTKYLILTGEDYWPIDNDGRYKPESYEPFEHGLLYLFWEIMHHIPPRLFIRLLNDQTTTGLITDSGKFKKISNDKILLANDQNEEKIEKYIVARENLINVLEKIQTFADNGADEIILKRTGNVLDAEAIWYKEVHE